ncbi:hypothetical protein DL96DRAFT_1706026 [Flagelloscypha sp. PMI_526]|nr:hypothetical protein DL96DRAFT_1706026 [Flagelloscypha sp. PMI_526]
MSLTAKVLRRQVLALQMMKQPTFSCSSPRRPLPLEKAGMNVTEAAFRQLGSMSRPSKALFRAADAPPSNPLPSRVTSASPQRSSGLARNAPGYSSSMSSIGSELEPRAAPPMIPRPASTNPTSSTTSSSSHTAHPILPSSSVPSSPSRKDTANLFPSDYPGSSSLRMDVGRRLFEGQQHRFAPRPPDQVQESDRRSLGPPAGIHG